MYCTSCGKPINDDDSFCQYCGAPLKAQSTSYRPNDPQQPYQQQPQQQLTATQQYLKDLKDSETKTYSKVLCVLGFIVSIINTFIFGLSNLYEFIPINIRTIFPIIGLIFSIPGLITCNKKGVVYLVFAIISIIINGYLMLFNLSYYL